MENENNDMNRIHSDACTVVGKDTSNQFDKTNYVPGPPIYTDEETAKLINTLLFEVKEPGKPEVNNSS